MLVILAEIDPMVEKNWDTHQHPPYKSGVGHLDYLVMATCDVRPTNPARLIQTLPSCGLGLVFGGQGGIEDAIGDAGDTYHLGYVVDADDVCAVQDAGSDGGGGAPNF